MSPFPLKSGLRPFLSLGGDDGIRTHDPLLAGQVLSQLSYTPSPSGFASRRPSGLRSTLMVLQNRTTKLASSRTLPLFFFYKLPRSFRFRILLPIHFLEWPFSIERR